MKKQYGLANVAYIDNDYNITLTTYSGEERTKTVRCSEIVEIMSARVEEMFELVKQILVTNQLENVVSSCVIAGQGFNSINKTEKIAEQILRMDVRFGSAKMANLIKPECATAYGVVKYISNIKHSKNIGSKVQLDEDQTFVESLFESVKGFVSSKLRKIKK